MSLVASLVRSTFLFDRRESGKNVGMNIKSVSPFFMASLRDLRRGWLRAFFAAILAERRSGPDGLALSFLFLFFLVEASVETGDGAVLSRGGAEMGGSTGSYGGLRGGEGGSPWLTSFSFLVGAAGGIRYSGAQRTLFILGVEGDIDREFIVFLCVLFRVLFKYGVFTIFVSSFGGRVIYFQLYQTRFFFNVIVPIFRFRFLSKSHRDILTRVSISQGAHLK